jgi:hypothetical protein
MRASGFYLLFALISFFAGIGVLFLSLDYLSVITSWLLAMIFFTVFMFLRIFELLIEIRQESLPPYEELEKIFKEAYIKKKKKTLLQKKDKSGNGSKRVLSQKQKKKVQK